MGLYVSISFSLGSYFHARGLIINVWGRGGFFDLPFFNEITAYIFLCIAACLLADAFGNTKALSESTQKKCSERSNARVAVPAVALLILAVTAQHFGLLINAFGVSFVPGDAIFVGAFILLISAFQKSDYRVAVYILLASVLIVFFYNDKRLFLMSLVTVLLIESHVRNYGRREVIRAIPVFAIGLTGLFIAIIVMTNIRNAGPVDSGNSITWSLVSPQRYFQNTEWASALGHNLEVAPTVFHTYDAISIQAEQGDFTYGSTVIKTIFLPVPRDLINWKPDSFLSEYNSYRYPEYRARGGSNPANLFAEAYWNFGILGVFYLFFLFIILRLLFLSLVVRINQLGFKAIFLFICYFYFVMLFRGSGLDMYVFYVVLSGLCALSIVMLSRVGEVFADL